MLPSGATRSDDYSASGLDALAEASDFAAAADRRPSGFCDCPPRRGGFRMVLGRLAVSNALSTLATLLVVMNMVLGKSELMNFSIEMIAPDMVFFVLAIYGYFKAK